MILVTWPLPCQLIPWQGWIHCRGWRTDSSPAKDKHNLHYILDNFWFPLWHTSLTSTCKNQWCSCWFVCLFLFFFFFLGGGVGVCVCVCVCVCACVSLLLGGGVLWLLSLSKVMGLCHWHRYDFATISIGIGYLNWVDDDITVPWGTLQLSYMYVGISRLQLVPTTCIIFAW